MAHARIDRKGFLKSLGVVATAFAARPAAAATTTVAASAGSRPVALNLPMKTRPEPRAVARRDLGA